MCRILMARCAVPFSISDHLTPFAALAKDSREYQGHGWGCSWLTDNNTWQHYHNIKPVWEDELDQFGLTSLLLVHARSAFRDEGIAVENNMPFTDGDSVFIFNGELRGVKIKSEGRIGAEKIYNYVRRMQQGSDNKNLHQALEKACGIISRRTSYVRAMNIILSDGEHTVASSTFGEDPDYFQMHRSVHAGVERVCSEPFTLNGDVNPHWEPVVNLTTAVV